VEEVKSKLPTNKLIGGTLGGAATAIIVWLANTYAAIEIPPEVASAITVLVSFVASWITSEK
jgi:hypothetical protein